MNSLILTTGVNGLNASADGAIEAGGFSSIVGEPVDSEGFSVILSRQGLSPELLEKLRETLPEGQFKELQALLNNGNHLPQVAEVAAEIESIITEKGLTPEILEQLETLLPEQGQGELKAIFWGNEALPEVKESEEGDESPEITEILAAITGDEDISDLHSLTGEGTATPEKDASLMTAAIAANVATEGETKQQRHSLTSELETRGEVRQPVQREATVSTLHAAISKEVPQGDQKLPVDLLRQLVNKSDEGADKGTTAASAKRQSVDESLVSTNQARDILAASRQSRAAPSVGEMLGAPAPQAPMKLAPLFTQEVTGQLAASVPVAPTAGQSSVQSAAPQPSGTPIPINVPPGTQGWNNAVGDRILWMVGQNSQSAKIRINPPHLGPIEVHVTVQKDQASVNFTALNGVVRDALETAIPRLREMFNENNMQLVNVDVGQKGAGEQSALRDFSAGSESDGQLAGGEDGAQGSGEEGEEIALSLQTLERPGGVDYYA